MRDHITISRLSIHLPNGLGPSAFALTPPPPCPILLDITINLHPSLIPLVATYDSMSSLGVNYSSVSKAIYACLSDRAKTFTKPEEVLEVCAGIIMQLECVDSVTITVTLPRALLRAMEVKYTATYTSEGEVKGRVCEIIELRVECVVGLHPHERRERQRLEIDLKVDGVGEEWDHKTLQDLAVSFLEQSSAGTLELLVDQLANHLLPSLPLGSILGITIRKPSALPFACPSISITRVNDGPSSRPQLEMKRDPEPESQSGRQGRIFIALGSNIGDRMGNIRRAVKSLESEDGIRVIRTGRMYESEPMYVEDQARFANTVIEITSNLEPLSLLKLLKRVEISTGRTKTFTNGPRVVDLDLLLYGDEIVKIGQKGDAEDGSGVGWLEVPHWGIAEREFVLRPLNDICPTLIHPSLNLPISVLLSRHPSTLVPVIPTAFPLRLLGEPLIMAIFNATPDSFSDGDSSNVNLESALSTISSILSSPHSPDILDIGGMSTRPNSTPCSEEEELQRVIPLIKAIREKEEWKQVVISIDTYRPNIAKAAIEAGANIINDVRGGREEGMLTTMANLGVPVILMHSRGDSKSMTLKESQEYHEGVVNGVKKELSNIIEKAIKMGVRSWDIISDPGIGFAKTPEQSIDLLRNVEELCYIPSPGSNVGRGWKYPVLVGASRKGFVGKVTGREVAGERGWGDAVVNSYCAGKGVDILRVHDWRGAKESVKMARALSASVE